jgi:hypothetical protein
LRARSWTHEAWKEKTRWMMATCLVILLLFQLLSWHFIHVHPPHSYPLSLFSSMVFLPNRLNWTHSQTQHTLSLSLSSVLLWNDVLCWPFPVSLSLCLSV